MEHDRRTSIQYLIQARNEELATTSKELPDHQQLKEKSVYPERNTQISEFENIYSLLSQQRSGESSFQKVQTTGLKRNDSTQQSFATIQERSEWTQDELSTQVDWYLFQDRPDNYGKVSRVEAGLGRYYPIFSTEHSIQRSSMTSSSHSSSLSSRQESTKTPSPHQLVTTSVDPKKSTKEIKATVAKQGSNESHVGEEGTSQRTKRREQIDEEERKRMRLIKNRLSAERSRRKQRERLEELVYRVKCLRQQNSFLKQDHLALLGYIENLKTCMKQNGILVEAVPIPYLHYPTSECLIEQLGRES
ncbi:hypothetical protein Gasu2_06020 [Galdieria sulphuraria]|nr:hypothetical protein Gasu2_06020 [Galdieria sulphuraria]